LTRLQILQNSCARLITGTKIRESITPALIQLHWLPMKFRYIYKLAVWGFKIINQVSNNVPLYLIDLLKIKKPERFTRSSSLSTNFITPKAKLTTVGGRSVHIHLASIWNSLPNDLKNNPSLNSFKSNLKTHLFRSAYTE
jgi:hypothetical protein